MKNNLIFVLSIVLVSSFSVGCKKEPMASIVNPDINSAYISGNCGWGMKKTRSESPVMQYQYHTKGNSPNVNMLRLSELSIDDIRQVRNNAVFKTDIKNQAFAHHGNMVYIERKRISKEYDFAILERSEGIIPLASAKGRSQHEMVAIARNQQWPDHVINKMESVDY